jgi:DNA-binding CsgD family transcriptional regulator
VIAGTAVGRLTDVALGKVTQELSDVLSELAPKIGVKHIAYLRFARNKSEDVSLLTGVFTYSKDWQRFYFRKQYHLNDPVVWHGVKAVLPFDWRVLHGISPNAASFFSDAQQHGVGRNGVTIPIRNRKNEQAIVSFSSDLPDDDWEDYKLTGMPQLELVSLLVDSAAGINAKLPLDDIGLSRREEQCLTWAARGKTYQEIAEILDISPGSVKLYLDMARHKLNCANLTHAVAVASASGVVPAKSLRTLT